PPASGHGSSRVPRAALPPRQTARCQVQPTFRWCCTCVSGWGRGVPQGCPGQAFTGTFTQGSSRTLKDNIAELPSAEALETLAHLSPVKFHYKADTEKANHIGFIAEDVPDLVSSPDRKGLSAMDIVGVLTK